MNTFMFLTFVLVFLLGIVTGAWLNAMTVLRAETRDCRDIF